MIVLFGIGNIADKTIKKYKLNKKNIILSDNSKVLWDTTWGKYKIIDPKKLKNITFKKIIICTTSYKSVVQQLKSYKIDSKKISISAVLDNFRLIDNIENISFDFLFVSGLPSIRGLKSDLKGGLYRIYGNFNKYKIEKKYSGNCHSLLVNKNSIFITDVNEGIVKLDRNGKILAKVKIQENLRPHGITTKDYKSFYLCLTDDDSIIHVNMKGRILRKYKIKSRNTKDLAPRHHVNDICYYNKNLYVSMFSIDGTWKSGRYDGGIIKINLNSGIMETQVSQLSMPHNILKENKKMYFCDSYNGKLIENKYNTKFQSNGFVRGFDSTDTKFVVCESKNRNFNRLKNGPINQCIDTRINIVDKKTGAYKSIQLPNYISEIHSLKIIKII